MLKEWEMKLAKRTRWILGIVAAAFVFAIAFVSRRESHVLSVRLIDTDTGQPINCAVKVEEHRLHPVLSSMRFLPDWMKHSIKVYSMMPRDGTLRIRRLKPSERRSYVLEIANDGPKEYPRVYFRSKSNGTEIRIESLKVVQLEPQQKEVSLALESRTYDGRR
jgi:hypothetical protein